MAQLVVPIYNCSWSYSWSYRYIASFNYCAYIAQYSDCYSYSYTYYVLLCATLLKGLLCYFALLQPVIVHAFATRLRSRCCVDVAVFLFASRRVAVDSGI